MQIDSTRQDHMSLGMGLNVTSQDRRTVDPPWTLKLYRGRTSGRAGRFVAWVHTARNDFELSLLGAPNLPSSDRTTTC